ncbi:FHA domain-containing protein [Azotosporobacter soli]|uniref:FHA domain-containing protein n=1 Tax=Azotosporobacter soli TaxID=3055040 RepID=UPI0031FE64AA
MSKEASFIVIKGEPYEAGTRLAILGDAWIIGRSSGSVQPDLGFSNYFVSRRHLQLHYREARHWLQDLGSKHGTLINGQTIREHEDIALKDGDIVSMALGNVVLRYLASNQFEQTMEIAEHRLLEHTGFVIEKERRQCIINGKVSPMLGKEWDLLLLLYQHANGVVGYEDIKRVVWAERVSDAAGVPDVELSEINTLVYRLRKKLQDKGSLIKAIPRTGYMLEVE